MTLKLLLFTKRKWQTPFQIDENYRTWMTLEVTDNQCGRLSYNDSWVSCSTVTNSQMSNYLQGCYGKMQLVDRHCCRVSSTSKPVASVSKRMRFCSSLVIISHGLRTHCHFCARPLESLVKKALSLMLRD